MKLQKGISTKNQKEIYYIKDSSTFRIKDKLGKSGLGLNYYDGMWWIYKEGMNSRIINGLTNLGIDTSILNSSGQEAGSVVENKSDFSPPKNKEEIPELTNKTDSMEGQRDKKTYESIPGEKYYGFKPNDNIYKKDIKIDVEGRIFEGSVQMGRWYEKGRRKIPVYIYSLYGKDGNLVASMKQDAVGAWGSYNEDKLALDIESFVNQFIEKKGNTYKLIKMHLNLNERPEEFSLFLDKWQESCGLNKDNISYDFISKYMSLPMVDIDGEEFPVLPTLGYDKKTVFLYTYVEHALKPENKLLGTFNIPSSFKSKEEVFELISKILINSHESVNKQYKAYLASFPYKKDDEEKSRAIMQEIVDKIKNRSFSPEEIKNGLINFGYIRANKRQKSDPTGIAGEQKWVVDSKKAVDSAYGRIDSPEKFYGVLGYWLHRKVKNISSWTDMMLTSAIDTFVRLIKRYGYEIDYKNLYNYLESLVNGVYKELFGVEAKKGVWDNYKDFYGGKGEVKTDGGRVLDKFVEFVKGLGIDEKIARENPKMVYRQLARKYHTDLNPNLSEKEQEVFKTLSQLFNALPVEMIRSGNWYGRMKK